MSRGHWFATLLLGCGLGSASALGAEAEPATIDSSMVTADAGTEAAADAAAEAPGVPPEALTILRSLAPEPGMKLRFVERHGNALLAEPLRLEGFVTLTGEGVLIREVEQPFAETARLDGDSASIERDGRQRRIALGGGRRGVYLRTLYALLSGDVDALGQAFDPSMQGQRDAWTLTLTPRAAELARLLEPVTLSGADDHVTAIRVTRNDGAWQEFQLAGPAP